MTTAELEIEMRAVLTKYGDLSRKEALDLMTHLYEDIVATGAAAEVATHAALAVAQAAADKAATLAVALVR
jgi:hypothetical protein